MDDEKALKQKSLARKKMEEDILYIAKRLYDNRLTPETATQILCGICRPRDFYCADWNRCGAICEQQCPACNKEENF